MKKFIARLTLAFMLAQVVPVQATQISQLPIDALSVVKPNVVFGLDDSGSMDWEIVLHTNNGMAWFNKRTASFWDSATNKPNFNVSGDDGPVGSDTWYAYAYLFPNGCSAASGGVLRHYCDGQYSHYAVPPLPAFAWLRSSDYNTLYYNPAITYEPWKPAYIGSATVTYANATPTAAEAQITNPGASPDTDLTATLATTAANTTFKMVPGMVIPGSTVSGLKGSKNGGTWQNITTNITVASGDKWDVSLPYYPATYYTKVTACPMGATCVVAPDGAILRQIEIKAATATYPSGRSYVDELQNFANWWQYARKRKLMLSSAMGTVLSSLTGINGGIVRFNNNSTVTMHDFDNVAASANAKALLGPIYTNPAWSGTPTRDTLKYIGEQYRNNTSIIKYACQKNSAFIMTDGFAQVSNVKPPAYDATKWGSGKPYATTYSPSLADIALGYYTLNLRPTFATGQVPLDVYTQGKGADMNTDLHMNTYGLTLGAKGRQWPDNTDPYANPPVWANPNVDYDPTMIDDLWHATINGRGQMYMATDLNNTITSIQNGMMDIVLRAGSQSAVGVSNVNMTAANNAVYVASYNGGGWFGDVIKYPVNLTSGSVDLTSPVWSARDKLDAKSETSRVLATSYNGTAMPFDTSLPAAVKSAINPSGIYAADSDKLVRYLRGDRSNEGALFRKRVHVLGDAVGAEPVAVQGAVGSYTLQGYSAFQSTRSQATVVYQAANDGFLHAFDGNTGEEKWAFMPQSVQSTIGITSKPTYQHQFQLDGSPTVGDVDTGGWWSILVGGQGIGGSGFYALDITNPNFANAAALSSAWKWEFPSTSAQRNNMGTATGKPLILRTKAFGWVVVLTSGYNNTAGDGKGHIWFLDPNTGAVLKELTTSDGTSGTPVGLASFSAYSLTPATDPTVLYLYGGDELGNLWKADISAESATNWGISKVTQFKLNSAAQPVTAAPELASTKDGKPLIFIGTGRLLGSNDLSDASQQSFYAIKDTGAYIGNPRSELVAKSMSNGTTRHITGATVDFTKHKGWYFDYPAGGERSVSMPLAAFGKVTFTTNFVSPNVCSTSSYFYVVDFDGSEPASTTAGQASWAGMLLTGSAASRPVIIGRPGGKYDAIIHQANNQISTVGLPIKNSQKPQAASWREVIR